MDKKENITTLLKAVTVVLDAMQAAILNVKLPYLNGWITRRNEIGKKYLKEITNSKISIPVISNNEFHAFHLFVIRSDERDKLRAYLKVME